MRTIRLFLWLFCLAVGWKSATAQGLMFRDPVVDVGAISEADTPRLYRFDYVNTSKEPVIILRVVTTCGCTQPAYSKRPILPGGVGAVSVTFHPLGRVGALHKSLLVYTNQSELKPAAELTLTGMVSPSKDQYFKYRYRMGPLRLRQVDVDFRVVTTPQQRVVRIEVANAGERPLRLRAFGLPPYVSFRTDPEVIAPNSVADLVFTLHSSQVDAPETLKQQIYLDGFGEPVLPTQRAINLRGIIK